MPDFLITSPDGTKYKVTGPDGASESDALVQLQKQLGQTSYADKSAMDIAGEAITNIPSSAVEFGKAMVHPVLHPIDTATWIRDIGAGVLQKIGILSGDDSMKYADAVGQYFADRYGSVEGIKKAIATDPVGVLADVATILTGGGMAAARAPGVIGKAGQVAATAGSVVDPLMIAARTAKGGAKLGSEVIGGMLTGTGGKTINESFMSGAKVITEPAQTAAFQKAYLNRGDPAEPVTIAQNAISGLIKERGAEYVKAMNTIRGDEKVLDFAKVDKAIRDTLDVDSFKGQSTKPTTAAVRNEIIELVERWKALPEEFHTAAGLDALKKSVQDIAKSHVDTFGRSTSSGVVANSVANAIKSTITAQVPEYAKIMNAYSEASDIIANLQRELSLGKNANIDTGLRKLQSVLRNNVTTAYGRREVLANYLKDHGADTLLAALAGQSMSTIIPRGLAAKMLAGLEGLFGGAAAGTAVAAGAGTGALPLGLGALALSSPKLVGGAAHLGGLALSPLYALEKTVPGISRGLGQSSFQLGRQQ
jgi:hypothetical protein